MFTLLWSLCPGRSGNRRVTFINLDCYSWLFHVNDEILSLLIINSIICTNLCRSSTSKSHQTPPGAPMSPSCLVQWEHCCCQVTCLTNIWNSKIWMLFLASCLKVITLPVDDQGVVWRSRSQPLQSNHLGSDLDICDILELNLKEEEATSDTSTI